MSKYTDGPWELDWQAEDEFALYADRTTCVMTGRVQDGDKSEQDANARLITAAPDLLEAAKRAEGILADITRGVGADHILSELHTAIEKAEGADA